MKRIILLGAIVWSTACFSQNEKQPELNCYNKWAAKFEERGAEVVPDGVYEDVIITTRQGSKAVCNNGKVEVKGGTVMKCYILLSDGSHEEVKRTWKNNSDKNVRITNGISTGMVSVHGEIINIIWPNMLKAKKAKPTVAADPTDD